MVFNCDRHWKCLWKDIDSLEKPMFLPMIMKLKTWKRCTKKKWSIINVCVFWTNFADFTVVVNARMRYRKSMVTGRPAPQCLSFRQCKEHSGSSDVWTSYSSTIVDSNWLFSGAERRSGLSGCDSSRREQDILPEVVLCCGLWGCREKTGCATV